MKITSKKIAELAGVSKSTVSKVLNDYSNIPEETKKRIFKIMKEHNYVPNKSAQLLAGKTSNVFGLFIVELNRDWDWKDAKLIGRSPYYSNIISMAIDLAKSMGYLFLVYAVTTARDVQYVCELFSSGTVSGGIFTGVEAPIPEFYEISNKNKGLVFLDVSRPSIDDGGNNVYITSNNISGIRKAIKHLRDFGHEKIAHLAGDLVKATAVERKNTFIQIMEEEGLKVEEKQIIEAGYIEELGYEAAKKLLKEYQPTAIVCANDQVAFGAIEAINEMGLRVPEDISLIGYDNIYEAQFSDPPLTTIEYSLDDMTSIALKYLVEKVEKKETFSSDFILPTKLIERESVTYVSDEKYIPKEYKETKKNYGSKIQDIQRIKKDKSMEIAGELLDVLDSKTIAEKTGISIVEVENLKIEKATKNNR